MELFLRGIGIVQNSSIKLDGLTVIAGNNNSGKTTVGKALYAIIDASSNVEEKHNRDILFYVDKQLSRIRTTFSTFRYFPYQQGIDEEIQTDVYPPLLKLLFYGQKRKSTLDEVISLFYSIGDDLQNDCSESFLFEELKNNTDISRRILFRIPPSKRAKTDSIKYIQAEWETDKQKALKIWLTTNNMLKQDPTLSNYINMSIERALRIEFSDQIQPVSPTVLKTLPDSNISFRGNVENTLFFNININQNRIDHSKSTYVKSPFSQAYFIDDPYVVDDSCLSMDELDDQRYDPNLPDLAFSQIMSHRNRMRLIMHEQRPDLSIIEEAALSAELQQIMKKIDDIVPGEFVYDRDGTYYVTADGRLRTDNLATGSKIFSIIKHLLTTGRFDASTILILDEPESHLHPNWINKLAEIVVLLVKELNITILLTTHSPNFLLAVDSYMREYKIQEKCNFYQTSPVAGAAQINYHNVTNTLDDVYEDFARSFAEMYALRNKYMLGGEE